MARPPTSAAKAAAAGSQSHTSVCGLPPCVSRLNATRRRAGRQSSRSASQSVSQPSASGEACTVRIIKPRSARAHAHTQREREHMQQTNINTLNRMSQGDTSHGAIACATQRPGRLPMSQSLSARSERVGHCAAAAFGDSAPASSWWSSHNSFMHTYTHAHQHASARN